MLAKSNNRILFLFLFFISSCQEVVVHDLDELRANQLKLILENNEIAVSKEKLGSFWQISVASEQAKKALEIIEKSRILLRGTNRFKEQSKSILQSREEKNQLLLRELAWSLEQTLERYRGVLEARVHLNLQVTPDFIASSKIEATASVLLIVKEKTEIKEAEIKQIISGASGIVSEKIAVIVSEQKMSLVNKDYSKKQKSFYIYPALGGGIFLFGIFVFIFKRRRKKKQRSNISESIDKEAVEKEFLIKTDNLIF